jgi:hypothetical protein
MTVNSYLWHGHVALTSNWSESIKLFFSIEAPASVSGHGVVFHLRLLEVAIVELHPVILGSNNAMIRREELAYAYAADQAALRGQMT